MQNYAVPSHLGKGKNKMLKLRTGTHGELEKYYPLLQADFDDKELLPKLYIHKAMLKGDMELCLIYDEESGIDLAYALVVKRGLYGYVLLKYFGVHPWYREQGLGVQAMRLLNKRYINKQGILAELTVFDDEDDQLLRKLRKFFARFGYVKIKSDYRIGGSEVELMVKPIMGTENIDSYAHRIIRDFYTRCLSPADMEKMIDIKPVKD